MKHYNQVVLDNPNENTFIKRFYEKSLAQIYHPKNISELKKFLEENEVKPTNLYRSFVFGMRQTHLNIDPIAIWRKAWIELFSDKDPMYFGIEDDNQYSIEDGTGKIVIPQIYKGYLEQVIEATKLKDGDSIDYALILRNPRKKKNFLAYVEASLYRTNKNREFRIQYQKDPKDSQTGILIPGTVIE